MKGDGPKGARPLKLTLKAWHLWDRPLSLVCPFIIFLLVVGFIFPLPLRADEDWGALEQALKDAGIISDPPAGGGNSQTQPPTPGGTGAASPPAPPSGTASGPVFPTGPDGRTLPLPPPSETSFPYDSTNTTYGQYESEGGQLWREFRDGKLTSEQYQQKMKELRDRIREREERERREQQERERPEREARAREAREEGEARGRAMRRERKRERRERRERERREREERQKQDDRVGMGQTGEGAFQAVDGLHAGFPGTGAPSARDMGPVGPQIAQHEQDRGNQHND